MPLPCLHGLSKQSRSLSARRRPRVRFSRRAARKLLLTRKQKREPSRVFDR
jgi:hypothetical protein